jgi:hypothetical protein
MEQKFNELHQKIDTVFDQHDTEIEEIRKDVSWLKQKIWMALGALAVISVVGGVFATYFKELNKNQINESLQNVLSKYNIVVDYEK